jgi:tetratricopeptide (TPR) repeat protein
MFKYLAYLVFLFLIGSSCDAAIWGNDLNNLNSQADVVSNFPVSSRSAALGTADLSLCDGTEALYLNPACLSANWMADIQANYVNLINNTHYHLLGFHLPLGERLAFGLGWAQLLSSGYQARDASGQYLGQFDHMANALTLGAGWKITPFFRWGANLKYFFQSLKNHAESGLSMDCGLAWHQENWGLGLAAQNLFALSLQPLAGLRATGKVPADFLDLNLRLGAHYRLPLSKSIFEQPTLFASFEFLKLQSSFLAYNGFWNHANLGFETRIPNTPLALRCALNQQHLAAGAAFTLQDFVLEYTCDLPALAPLHWFSLRWQVMLQDPAQHTARLNTSHEAAQQAFQNGEYEQAILRAKETLLLDPENEDAQSIYWQSKKELDYRMREMLALAQAYIELRAFDAAYTIIKQANAMALQAGANLISIQEIELLAETTWREEAQKQLEEEQSSAEAAEKAQNWALALRQWEAVLLLAPDHAEAREKIAVLSQRIQQSLANYFQAALSAMRNEKYWKAVELFNLILKFDPAYPQAGLLKAQCRKILAPELQRAAARMAKALATADYVSARREAETIAEADPSYPGLQARFQEIARYETQSKNSGRVVAMVQKMASEKRLSQALAFYAFFAKNRLLNQEIERFFSGLRRRQQKIEEAKNQALALLRENRFDEGIRDLRDCLAQDANPRTTDLIIQAYMNAGIHAYRADELESALGYWQAAEKLDKNNPLLQTYLKRVKNKSKNIQKLINPPNTNFNPGGLPQ